MSGETLAFAREWHAIVYHGVHAGGDLVAGDERVSAADLKRRSVAERWELADRWIAASGGADALAAYRRGIEACARKSPLRAGPPCDPGLDGGSAVRLTAADLPSLAPSAPC